MSHSNAPLRESLQAESRVANSHWWLSSSATNRSGDCTCSSGGTLLHCARAHGMWRRISLFLYFSSAFQHPVEAPVCVACDAARFVSLTHLWQLHPSLDLIQAGGDTHKYVALPLAIARG